MSICGLQVRAVCPQEWQCEAWRRVQARSDAREPGDCQAGANCDSCTRWQWQILATDSGQQ